MGADQNKAVVQPFIEQAFNAGNLTLIDDLVDSALVWLRLPRR